MHHEHIYKVTDTMMQSAKTPGQGITPGNPDIDTHVVGKGEAVFKNAPYLANYFESKE